MGRRGGPQVCGQHSARTCLHHPPVSCPCPSLPRPHPERTRRVLTQPGEPRQEGSLVSGESYSNSRGGRARGNGSTRTYLHYLSVSAPPCPSLPPSRGEEDARYAVSSPSPASQDKKGESGRVCLGGWQTRGEYGPPRGKGGRKARLPGVPRDTSGPGDPAFPQISSPRAPPSRPWFQLN